MTDIDLSTGAPPDPAETRKLAETMAELARVLNHRTRHHEALRYPPDADKVVREIALMASRLPQLLEQVGSWLADEEAAAGVEVTSGQFAGRPAAAVTAARLRLDAARLEADELHGALEYAGHVLAELGAAEDEDDGSR
jgi:hypothetical protein